ncbi:MAG: cytochrome c3 family protein [Spirochaetota bacterium]|nr:cytochrome c3 family protein [Spirochaetota bacterium]
MKKIALIAMIGFIAVAMVGYFANQAMAGVGGVCSNCHTMHNSQGGVPVDADGPNEVLLNNDCIGCHTSAASDPLDDVNNTPFVMLSGASDDNCLAGGFFTTANPLDDNGNNTHDIGATADPAGFNSAETPWYTGNTGDGLGCAGTNGCHGNQTDLNDMAAIAGGHHNTSLAYRMLYIGTAGVLGTPASDYEEALIGTGGVVTDPHNVYSAGVLDPSISELCAKCHGDFHNESGTTEDCGAASPWIRHPTDVDIPGTWAIGDETNDLTRSDYKNNPVGFVGGTETGERRATCLSCHRAHGTANNDLLRWDYGTQVAAGGNAYGCLGCHDAQR